MVRDLAGFIGLALLTAVLASGALAWIGPVAYLGITMPALGGGWTTPWTWPARPPHDRGAAICAALVLAAGLMLVTVRGARDSLRD
jgi:amino acid transporter